MEKVGRLAIYSLKNGFKGDPRYEGISLLVIITCYN